MSPTERVDAQVCYLLATPWREVAPPSPPEPIERLKDAPYFAPIDVDIRTLDAEALDVDGTRVSIRRQVLDGVVQVAECSYALPDALSLDALQIKVRLQAALYSRLTAAVPDLGDMFEEYTVLMLGTIAGAPDEFVDRNGQALARFMRSQREVFDPHEIHDILISRVRYSELELTVVDWEGAVVVSLEHDFQSDVELLKIGNYQLLRYRLLDQAIERSLRAAGEHLHAGLLASLLPNRARRVLRQVIEQRLALILDFERIDQGLLLIGDWYTAKLFRVIYGEFYLDKWKSAIESKLENLESINQLIQENFSFSWTSFLEFMQIAGWLILLAGYFVLFFLESRPYR